ncbi:hypothetical protein AB0M80_35365 [Amycolatopsis sp. NPDC051045]|uniref:hypothetical protein n=1 Tax=Amycolatopsis sp. NPDC051045 TaxID=3156922 RepID=UPI0034321EF0
MIDLSAERSELAAQLAHWRAATLAFDDLESFAAEWAWSSLEQYLGMTLRSYLAGVVDRLREAADTLAADVAKAQDEQQLAMLRRRVLAFKQRVLQSETVLDFYGDAVNTRTSPRQAALLTACDLLAAQSMTAALRPLGHAAPPVLTYVDKGAGASVLRAGLRLWDAGAPSPVAAIKVVRHSLLLPTSLLHESGHQVAHITGWTAELGQALTAELGATGPASAWTEWVSEVAADVFAFAHIGYAAVAGLQQVISGGSAAVFRYPVGDPHPIPYLRILFGTTLCRTTYGAGPWDDLTATWVRNYPLDHAPDAVREVVEASMPLLPRLAELCLLAPQRAFGGRSLVALVDPTTVRPEALTALEFEVQQGKDRSVHWSWLECVRLLALAGWRVATTPRRAQDYAAKHEDWMLRIGGSARQSA